LTRRAADLFVVAESTKTVEAYAFPSGMLAVRPNEVDLSDPMPEIRCRLRKGFHLRR
jgi:hypothetical protein